jgi:putative ATP-dependent endonuclease of OLD family
MRISRLSIANFRSLKSLELELDDTTVFIGANNAGKSAILEAVRITLTRRWGQRGTGFTEHDVHCPNPGDDPRTLPPVSIEIALEERDAGSWPDDMLAALDEIATTSASGRSVITLRISCTWNETEEAFEPAWEFLDALGNPLTGKATRSTNLSGFFGYLPLFWLGALRDAIEEFGPRSSYWGRLLRSIKVAKATRDEIKTALDELDAKLLASDPRLETIANTVGQATQVAINEGPGAARLRMLPLDVWELLSRAGLVMRNDELRPWLPLDHHGQGLQSLSVMYLFQAAVIQQLADDPKPGAEPVFAIEEPEAHLHPQAARTLWDRISGLPGQKLVTTHSPYFVQHVPLHNLRIVRLIDGQTKVSRMRRRVNSSLPWNANIETYATKGPGKMFVKDEEMGLLAVTSWFDEKIEAGIVGCWPTVAGAATTLAALRNDCRALLSGEDEDDLAIAGRRIRGEIFFARRWLLVEGQSEYILLHALGRALGLPLDQHGIAVIDFKNNGNASVYPALATAFEIPWRMITDGDAESMKFLAELHKRGFSPANLASRFFTLPNPNTLETQLIADGHEPLLRTVLGEIGVNGAATCTLAELISKLKDTKIGYMSALARYISADAALAARMPALFVQAINDLKSGTL